MSKLTALITGASGGIGLEIAKLHAANKYDLVLVARNQTNLERVKTKLINEYGISVHIIATDLTQEDNVKSIFDYIKNHNLRIDHLINNAGMGVFGKLNETSLDDNLKMMDLNNRALVILTHHFVQCMVSHGSGKILNIASTAAFMPGPYMSIYFASKAFVLSFSEAVNSELSGTGVSVTTLCPGPTNTGFVAAANGMENSGLFAKQKVSTPKEVAKDGYQAMMNKEAVRVSGFLNKVSVFSTRLSPRSWVTALTKSITKPL